MCCAGLKITQIAKIVGERWKALGEEQRKVRHCDDHTAFWLLGGKMVNVSVHVVTPRSLAPTKP